MLIAGGAILAGACRNSNEVTGAHVTLTSAGPFATATPTRIPPTATPTPVGSIAGSWTGTVSGLNVDEWDPCVTSSQLPAQATFEQHGSSVTGALTLALCFHDAQFQGTVQGGHLDGTIRFTFRGDSYSGAASGPASSSQLTLQVPALTDSSNSRVSGFDLQLAR